MTADDVQAWLLAMDRQTREMLESAGDAAEQWAARHVSTEPRMIADRDMERHSGAVRVDWMLQAVQYSVIRLAFRDFPGIWKQRLKTGIIQAAERFAGRLAAVRLLSKLPGISLITAFAAEVAAAWSADAMQEEMEIRIRRVWTQTRKELNALMLKQGPRGAVRCITTRRPVAQKKRAFGGCDCG